MTTGTLLAIAIKSAPREPMITLPEVEITTDGGLAGDSRGASRRRQVTIIAREAWERACDTLGADVPWTARRANLIVEGFDFENSEGRVLRIGPVRLEITGETLPCPRMDEAHPGLLEALTPEWRGGVTTSVLSAGIVRPGDAAGWDDPE
jgi:MOSC domain-containing protein YiiM